MLSHVVPAVSMRPHFPDTIHYNKHLGDTYSSTGFFPWSWEMAPLSNAEKVFFCPAKCSSVPQHANPAPSINLSWIQPSTSLLFTAWMMLEPGLAAEEVLRTRWVGLQQERFWYLFQLQPRNYVWKLNSPLCLLTASKQIQLMSFLKKIMNTRKLKSTSATTSHLFD